MGLYDHLFTLWRDPGDGTRHVVGELWRDSQGYGFAYLDDLTQPVARGFQELSEFPVRRGRAEPYRAEYLFPSFAQRIPDPRRTDRTQILSAWGVEHPDDPMEILARSGGVQLTDRIELAEYRAGHDTLERPLEFRVSGMRFQPDALQAALRPGAAISLLRDPTNRHDPHASLVLVHDETRVGYVPRQYSAMVARLLDAGVALDGVIVRKLLLPAETGRWVVRLVRRAAPRAESV